MKIPTTLTNLQLTFADFVNALMQMQKQTLIAAINGLPVSRIDTIRGSANLRFPIRHYS